MRGWLRNWTPSKRAAVPQCVGLALGGGFARGIAHIGVLEVLDQHGIPIDMIAGTSSGSLVAAAYASGLAPQQIAAAAGRLRLRDVGRWTLSRLGLASNLRMEVYLRRLLSCTEFEKMRIPLLIPATDLYTGEVEVFRSGSVFDAIRASCAYPLMYQPVRINGHYYVDGGLVCVVPAEPLRRAGADFIISVELGGHWSGAVPHNMLEVLGQSFSIAVMAHSARWRHISDVLLQPAVDGIAHDAFDRSEQIIEAGRAAALRALPEIKNRLRGRVGAAAPGRDAEAASSAE